MDKDWDALVEEGKRLLGDYWRLGDLACQVQKDYGKNSIAQYAENIGENLFTLMGWRTTALAWPDKKTRPRKFSLGRSLNAHPHRVEIVMQNPNMTASEARAEMTAWKATQPSKKPRKPKADIAPGRNSEPEIDRSTLSMSAQQKLEAIARRDRREIAAELEERFYEEKQKWLQWYKKVVEDAKAVQSGRKAMVTREEATAIKRCLHPDNSASQEMRNKAFLVWQRLEHVLMSEQDSPTVVNFPSVAWQKKAKATA
jgi:hypothetical protein